MQSVQNCEKLLKNDKSGDKDKLQCLVLGLYSSGHKQSVNIRIDSSEHKIGTFRVQNIDFSGIGGLYFRVTTKTLMQQWRMNWEQRNKQGKTKATN